MKCLTAETQRPQRNFIEIGRVILFSNREMPIGEKALPQGAHVNQKGEAKSFWFAGTSPQTKTISSSVPSVSPW